MIRRDDATEAQVRAARPDASTWLAANAGSGKTRVLTDRVARLLLEGVEPQHILCLTYTKAAASEMQNRLFRRLGQWAMLEDDALRASLVELGAENTVDAAGLRNARTLFARAIETPGGLKIQTIHSFCASLLRRFPLEAEVSPQFTEIEDRAADLLRAEIVDQMADSPQETALVVGLAQHYTGEDFGALTRAVVQHSEQLRQPLSRAEILRLFGAPDTLTSGDVARMVFTGGEQSLIDRIIPVGAASGKTDQTLAARLAAIASLDSGALPELESIFLYASGEYVGQGKVAGTSKPALTKAARKLLGTDEAEADALMNRLAAARPLRLALAAADKSEALFRFAQRFLQHYAAQKQQRGWLDFDDLIQRARDLLTNPDVAAWVLYRIDGGIDHILVDEAQDTSPAQWDVIRKLAAEFSSGEGARQEKKRTLFVVGDKKQSIYSFQGADPREFDRMQAEFREKLEAAGQLFQSESLQYSFRSSDAILRLVDQTFNRLDNAGFGQDGQHLAFHADLPGRVDLWPLTEPQEEEDERAWYDPLDRRSARHHDVVLAEKIADCIKAMIDSGQTIPAEDKVNGRAARRPVTAGDFLILVQQRQNLFSEIIRACKRAGLPIAGADRLKIGAELAVRDLAALLSFLAVAEDDLSLASALKSPLFGWSEQDLYGLAHKRTEKYLWEALRDQEAEYPDTLAILHDLRARTEFLRPYDLIERILTRHGGRRRLLSRLGAEAEDGINALLSQALAYERTSIPSLTGFLVWMQTDDLEIKRQIDNASDQIRVMTVHGAKGLEAPIVILPDTTKRNITIREDLLKIGNSTVWKTASDDMPTAMADRVAEMKEAEREERLRLLYVALTRAEKWLIVAGAGELSKENDSWYQLVSAAMDHAHAGKTVFQGETIRRLEHGDWDSLPVMESKSDPVADVALPDWLSRPAPDPAPAQRVITPSDLGGAKALAGTEGRDEAAAKKWGRLVHSMLEHMSATPPSGWPDICNSLRDADTTAADLSEAEEEASRVLNNPELQHLFSQGTLAEVAVSAPAGPDRIYGIVDRLIVTDDHVLAVDFKTNRAVPESPVQCPEGILRQMSAYASALALVYPGKRVETAILWTRNATLMSLPHEIVTDLSESALYLDDAGSDT
ncbi:double-strand break repair helicase AddA [uncultured Roseobacter sp.]|uniref:double-strand break repair helicase AddA n=1 Tax=uncultured Roseobacter sp. TaxID=114847 RepID=UPI002635AFAA|nr:double-strand break repair helicase AddA [uncultured Roseobacter sp.]